MHRVETDDGLAGRVSKNECKFLRGTKRGKVLRALSMQVRAARDVGRPEMDEPDLLYEFYEILPQGRKVTAAR